MYIFGLDRILKTPRTRSESGIDFTVSSFCSGGGRNVKNPRNPTDPMDTSIVNKMGYAISEFDSTWAKRLPAA